MHPTKKWTTFPCGLKFVDIIWETHPSRKMGNNLFFSPFHNISKYPPQSSYSAAEFMTKSAVFWWGKIQTPCHGWMAEGTRHILYHLTAVECHSFPRCVSEEWSTNQINSVSSWSNKNIQWPHTLLTTNIWAKQHMWLKIIVLYHIHSTHHTTFPTVKSYIHQLYTWNT